MRRTLKFLHTMSAIGFTGAIAALIVLHTLLPDPSDLQRWAVLREAMGAVARWILFPSMAVVVVSGLFAMAASTIYQNAGWVWAKLLSGILVLEGTLVYVQAPMERGARAAEAALAGEVPVAELGASLGAEWGSFWVIGGVAVVNVVLGIWRPRFARRRRRAGAGTPTEP